MNGFTFYKSFYETLKRIKNSKDRATAAFAICEYMFDDKEPAETAPETVCIVFESVRHTLDKAKSNGQNGKSKSNRNEIETQSNDNRNTIETETNEIETETRLSSRLSLNNNSKKERKKEIYINNNPSACAHTCESHEELLRGYGLPEGVIETLKSFLRHCYLNKHLVTNEKLEDIAYRLVDRYGRDAKGMNDCINKAISGGYLDIKA